MYAARLARGFSCDPLGRQEAGASQRPSGPSSRGSLACRDDSIARHEVGFNYTRTRITEEQSGRSLHDSLARGLRGAPGQGYVYAELGA